MTFALLVLLSALVLALVLGLQLGRVIHYARGYEAGANHASAVLRAAIIEGTKR